MIIGLVRRAVKLPEMAGIVSQKNARQRHGSLPVGFERSAKVGDKIAAYSAPRKLLMLRSAAALRSTPSEMSKMHFRNAAARPRCGPCASVRAPSVLFCGSDGNCGGRHLAREEQLAAEMLFPHTSWLCVRHLGALSKCERILKRFLLRFPKDKVRFPL